MWQNIRSIFKYIAKREYLLLILILPLAYYLAYIPHNGYPYPVHLDEWVHMTESRAILSAQDIDYPDPYYGESAGTPYDLELGFHLFWAVFHKLSGIPWLVIIKYFPGIIFMMTVLAVYAFARREGYGWQAALLTCLIPTTVGILGPGFFVPLALGLLFIPLLLLIVFHFKSLRTYLVVLIFMAFLLAMHPVTAVGWVLITTPYICINFKKNVRSSLLLLSSIVLPYLVLLPLFGHLTRITIRDFFAQQPLFSYVEIPSILNGYGIVPVLLSLLGIVALAMRKRKGDYGIVFGILLLLLSLVSMYVFNYGVMMLYYRGLVYLMLMLGIAGGAGLLLINRLRVPENIVSRLRASFITQNVGKGVSILVICLVLAMIIPSRLNTPYYHMIDKKDYQAFSWMSEHITNENAKAVLNPWKGIPFAAITRIPVHTAIRGYTKASDEKAFQFLHNSCNNTAFLLDNNINIVYTLGQCDNDDLVEVRDNVYILKELEMQD